VNSREDRAYDRYEFDAFSVRGEWQWRDKRRARAIRMSGMRARHPVVVVLCIFCLFGAFPSVGSSAAAAEPVSMNPPGRLVDLGGRSLHIDCSGPRAAGPTIVFESGLGEGFYVWALVRAEIQKERRACAYDRAGIGFSDPTPHPRTVDALNADLHELLVRSGETGPFVLVGHSLGGLLANRYARRYANEVAGLVLVDSAHEDGGKNVPKELLDLSAAGLAKRSKQLETWRETGRYEEMTFHDNVPASLLPTLQKRSATRAWWEARFAENTLPDADDGLAPEARRLSIPLVVVTATRWTLPNGFPKDMWEKDVLRRRALQDELATRSRRSRQVLVATSHYVPMEAPKAVADAIREVLVSR
jgi:pimeloyl-ACP methyl ester carboxylesterase